MSSVYETATREKYVISYAKKHEGRNVMRDYEKLYTRLVHEKLKGKVVGKVFVEVNDNDEIYIQITTHGNLVFRTYIRNFSEKFVNGYTPDYAVYEVVGEYKKFIMNTVMQKYFL